MKITTRLGVLIGVAIAALTLISLISFMQLRSVNQVVEQVTHEEIPSLEATNGFQTDYQRFRALIFRHISEPDMEKKAALDQQIRQAQSEIGERLAAYGKTLKNPERQTQFKDFQEMFQTYMLICDTALARSRQGQSEAAMELASSPFIEDAATLAFDALEKLSQATREQVKTAETAAATAYRSAQWWMGGMVLLISAGFIAFGMFFARSMTRPLFSMRDTLTDIGQQLDLTRRLPHVSRDEIGETVDAFNAMAGKLQESLKYIAQGADGVSGSSDDMAHTAEQLAQSAGLQSDAATVIAAAIEQMTVSINHIADRAGEARELATHSGESAKTGAAVIAGTMEQIKNIADAVAKASDEIIRMRDQSAQISKVVQVIREIADQTNLLALNAAIEAARAGEQGRGFAVVADEVRKLAERTAQSTSEIGSMIATTQQGAVTAANSMDTAVQRVKDGVRQAETAEQSITRIVGAAHETGDIVNEITLAIREQSAATNSIAQQVERIALMTEDNSHTASQAAGLAQRLKGLAASMRDTVARYRF